MKTLTIIGGGLAGSEAAWQAAERGIQVDLYEMRPSRSTGAHAGGDLAELVCSNSLGSHLPDRAGGVLKYEMEQLNSLLLRCARETAVPAGGCLAVDREAFSSTVTRKLEAHPRLRILREEVTALPDGPCIVASGPLTSPALSEALAEFSGDEHLFFYDAISPIVKRDSINMELAFRASRWNRGEQEDGDYINCPLNREQYATFVEALLEAERIELESFETEIDRGIRAGVHQVFEGCLPIEILAARGPDALRYGPMRPVGLDDPRTGRWPYAVLQLRQDNLAGSCYNMVGFQTNLRFSEQKRIFGMIDGLADAEYVRYGQMHRNTFLHAPKVLYPSLQAKARHNLFFAGQITGVEGYAGNIATGQLAGINATRWLEGKPLWVLPKETMLGALCHYVTHAADKDFQPMKANFGILPPLDALPQGRRGKRGRAVARTQRAARALAEFLRREEDGEAVT